MPYSQLVMQRECLRPQCLGHRCCSESPQNQHILLLCALPLLQDRPRNLEAKGPWKDIDGSQKGSFRVQAEGRWWWTAPSHFRPGQSRSDGAHSPLQGTSTLWAVSPGTADSSACLTALLVLPGRAFGCELSAFSPLDVPE